MNLHTALVEPLHGPAVELVNVAPAEGTAVNVTKVCEASDVPAGDCEIVPGPLTEVVSVKFCGAKVAVTVTFPVSTNEQIALVLPAQAPPDQPVNVPPVSAAQRST